MVNFLFKSCGKFPSRFMFGTLYWICFNVERAIFGTIFGTISWTILGTILEQFLGQSICHPLWLQTGIESFFFWSYFFYIPFLGHSWSQPSKKGHFWCQWSLHQNWFGSGWKRWKCGRSPYQNEKTNPKSKMGRRISISHYP